MRHSTFPHTRRAFTLVELLTVVIIIAIMATISLTVMVGAMQTAREAKTRATIQRIDTAILEIFEKYEERYEEILTNTSSTTFDTEVQMAFGLGNVADVTEGHRVAVRLHMIRDLMRMEMPSSWVEVTTGPIPFRGRAALAIPQPAVVQYYKSAHSNANNPSGSGALLYLIVANLNPEALEFFGASEIADTNGDGLLEFIDAWGRPIKFLRWAPALVGSDLQADVITRSGHVPSVADYGKEETVIWKKGPSAISDADWNGATAPSFAEACVFARSRNPDPFDKYTVQRAWFLYPLIFSAGPDGIDDIYMVNGDPPLPPAASTSTGLVQGMLDPYEYPYGYPRDEHQDGVLNHYDNITNHQR